MTNGPRYRFAPSPTGFFHVGGARTALMNWALARRLGGRFVLRIEDTDEARNRPEWTQGIIDALAWIGISADDPTFEGPYFQSANAAAHVAAAERLFADGRAYYCDMTGEEIQARAKAEGVPGYGGWSRDRGLGPGPGRALRFRTPDEGATVVRDAVRGEVSFANETIEDFVLLRGNGTPIFLLANVVDDLEMGITHVLRAEEHLPNTPKQQLLWEALGHDAPAWAHVPVLVNEKRKKLSKRRDKVALESFRDEGYLAAAMVNYLMMLGWAPKGDTEIVPWSVIEDEFRLEDVTHSPAFFDLKKLRRLQRRLHPGPAARGVRRRVRAVDPRRLGLRPLRPHGAGAADPLADARRRPRPGRLPVHRRTADGRGVVDEGDEPAVVGAAARRGGRGLRDGAVGQGRAQRAVEGDRRVARRQAAPGAGPGACRRHGPPRRAAAVRVARRARPRGDAAPPEGRPDEAGELT